MGTGENWNLDDKWYFSCVNTVYIQVSIWCCWSRQFWILQSHVKMPWTNFISVVSFAFAGWSIGRGRVYLCLCRWIMHLSLLNSSREFLPSPSGSKQNNQRIDNFFICLTSASWEQASCADFRLPVHGIIYLDIEDCGERARRGEEGRGLGWGI